MQGIFGFCQIEIHTYTCDPNTPLTERHGWTASNASCLVITSRRLQGPPLLMCCLGDE